MNGWVGGNSEHCINTYLFSEGNRVVLIKGDHIICNPNNATHLWHVQGTNKMSFYGRSPEGTGRYNVKISVLLSCHISRPLIGQKRECFIVEEVIEVDELDESNISAAAGKQGWAELFHTLINIKLYQITLNYKIFWNTNF